MTARITTIAVALILVAALTGCGPQADNGAEGNSPKPSASASQGPSDTATDSPEPTTSPTPSATPAPKPIALPTDCRAILSNAVLEQLKDVPLNDAAMGPSGVGTDGTLTCIWRNPQADTTALVTKISKMASGPALDLMNGLVASDGFTCYESDGGKRCEKTWPNEQYPVTDGRTLFWRQDVLIDTRYSNLAPKGYTSSIVANLFG